ncbi:uncharacterized protein F4812DRAFT_436044 [Daldinia caldariorum]|uniref:uncharacterized protein n=1 Tax=Daldinia caldariorum TaxID=326644 RepID=UPI00200841E2|nr:uncharacterized protein F4812DRAFT_436044 [Daldinia caldariorum]KAI1466130.1 hypothetical protein F4812DRAFT_436044 [Daldinia caldariorum]
MVSQAVDDAITVLRKPLAAATKSLPQMNDLVIIRGNSLSSSQLANGIRNFGAKSRRNPVNSMINGCGRCIQNESPDINLQILDFDKRSSVNSALVVEVLLRLVLAGSLRVQGIQGLDEIFHDMDLELRIAEAIICGQPDSTQSADLIIGLQKVNTAVWKDNPRFGLNFRGEGERTQSSDQPEKPK